MSSALLNLPPSAPVREFAGLTGRGRTPKSAYVAYLAANPTLLKKCAHEVGIVVPKTGPTSETVDAVALFI